MHSLPQTPKRDRPAASDGGNTLDEVPNRVEAVERTDLPCRLTHAKAGTSGQPGRCFPSIRPQSMLPLAARASRGAHRRWVSLGEKSRSGKGLFPSGPRL